MAYNNLYWKKDYTILSQLHYISTDKCTPPPPHSFSKVKGEEEGGGDSGMVVYLHITYTNM